MAILLFIGTSILTYAAGISASYLEDLLLLHGECGMIPMEYHLALGIGLPLLVSLCGLVIIFLKNHPSSYRLSILAAAVPGLLPVAFSLTGFGGCVFYK